MENVFIFIIAIGAAVFVALPFFKRRFIEVSQGADSQGNPIEERLRRLNSEKESIYSALKEIDFDYDTGKLSKEDYDELERKYKAQALALIKEIDGIEGKANVVNLDEEVEKEIRAIRKIKPADDEEIEKEILRARKSQVLENSITCSKCGNEYKSDDRFCSRCGARLGA